MLSGSTLVLLGVAWAVVLVPRALRDRRTSPSTTVTGFNEAMARLAVCDQRLLVVPTGSGQRLVVHPPRLRRRLVQRRRRVVLVRLLVVAGGAIASAVAVGRPWLWAVAATVTLVLVAYCVALRRLVVLRTGSATVVRLHPSIAARRRRVERAAVDEQGGEGSVTALPPVEPVRAGGHRRTLRFDDVRGTVDRSVDDGDDGLLFGAAERGRARVFEPRPALAADAR